MKIVIGSDKSGFVLKEGIKDYLKTQNVVFDDLGTVNLEEVKPYFYVAASVAPLIQNNTYDLAILVCGTGAGMAVVANKFEGVYAVACESIYSAKMARAVNGAQVLCMGGWIVAPEMGVKMVEAFINTTRFQDLEEWRIAWLTNADNKVKELEGSIYDK